MGSREDRASEVETSENDEQWFVGESNRIGGRPRVKKAASETDRISQGP